MYILKSIATVLMLVAAVAWIFDVFRPDGMDRLDRRIAAFSAAVICLQSLPMIWE